MRIHIIACRVLSRELSYLSALSKNIVDITWVGRGLHNTPEKLRANLKATLDDIYRQLNDSELEHRPDYIVLGYGLCSNSVVGLECRDIPIVVPRTDDCIALFMGSQKRYMDEFNAASGAYWLNSGWIEHSGTLVDAETMKRRRWLEYAEKFGEDNADYLIEVESGWLRNYSVCGFIHSDVFDNPDYERAARATASAHGWNLHKIEEDTRLLSMMVDGSWNDDEFLVLKAGERIAADYTGKKLKAVSALSD